MIKKLAWGFVLVAAIATVRAANVASDNANDATYTGTSSWSTGQNGGSGFGAWTLASDANGGSAGFFLAGSGDTDLNGIATGTHAWGTFANGANFQDAVAFRGFTGGSMLVGQTFSISMENGGVQTGGSAGFTLRTGNTTTTAGDYNTGSRFELFFLGGGSNYSIVDSTGVRDTGIGFTDGGLTMSLTLTGTDTYSFSLSPVGGSTTTLTGTLAGTAGAGLDSFAMFNRDAELANVYFNSVGLSAVPEPSTLSLLAGPAILGALFFIRRRRA